MNMLDRLSCDHAVFVVVVVLRAVSMRDCGASADDGEYVDRIAPYVQASMAPYDRRTD